MHLHEGLDQLPGTALRRLAGTHGINVDDSATRRELVERLELRLCDSEYLTSLLGNLPSEERQALLAARLEGGDIGGFTLGRILGSSDPERFNALLEKGLLFRTFAPLGPHRGEIFTVPGEVLDLLPSSESAGRGPDAPTFSPPPPRDSRRTTDPVFSLFAIASYLERRPADEDGAQTSIAFGKEVEGWTAEPGGWGWQERWTFLTHVGVLGGLLERRAETHLHCAASARRLFADRQRLIQRIWEAYARDRAWTEGLRAQIPRVDVLSEKVDAPSFRSSLMRLFRGIPPGSWMSVTDLLKWVRQVRPDLLREQLDSQSAALSDPERGGLLFDQGSWERIEEPLLRYVLLGPWYWLGIVAADAAGKMVALTRSGRAFLDEAGPPPPRAPVPCTWDGNSHLVAPSQTQLADLLKVENYLVLKHRGQMSRYALERTHAAEQFAQGGSVAELRTLLEALTQAELPQPVAETLKDWEEKFGSLRLRPAVLLEGESAEDLDGALRTPAIASLVRARLGERVAEVPASHASEIARALRTEGFLPHVDAALQFATGRRSYASLVDERVLEFLLVVLSALQRSRPEHLAHLEGATEVLRRLERLFSKEQLASLHRSAEALADDLGPPMGSPLPEVKRRRRRAGR